MTQVTEPTHPRTTAAIGSRRIRAISELPGPRGLPLLGNLLQLETNRWHTILNTWADEFGPMYRYRVLNRDAVVIADASLINEVLRNRSEERRVGKECRSRGPS